MTVQNRITAIEKLIEKSEKSFNEAKLLLEQNYFEAAISRAYYSMFYLTQAVLATKDISRKKHSGVIAVFAEQFTKPGIVSRDLHYKLRRTFEERQVSDYEFEISKTEQEAKEILKYSEDFSRELIPFLQKWIEENKS